MMTSQELADLLRGVNVRETAAKAGVSEKTIYRLRHKKNPPNLATVEKLLAAIGKPKRAAKVAA